MKNTVRLNRGHIIPLLAAALLFISGCSLAGEYPSEAGTTEPKYTTTIQVDYSIYGLTQGFELFRDITPYADSQMTEELTVLDMTPNDQVYIYQIGSDKELSKVYLSLPVIYTAEDIEPVSCKLKVGEVMYLSDGSPWFSISAIDGKRVSLEIYDDTMLPREFTVKAEGGDFTGVHTGMTANNEGKFEVKEASFLMNTAYEFISRVSDDITITVPDVMARYTPEEYKASGDGVEVVFVDQAPVN